MGEGFIYVIMMIKVPGKGRAGLYTRRPKMFILTALSMFEK